MMVGPKGSFLRVFRDRSGQRQHDTLPWQDNFLYWQRHVNMLAIQH